MIRKKWNIANLLYNEITTFDYSLKYTDSTGTVVTLYDGTTFYDKIMYKYTSWAISAPSFYDTETNQIVYLASDINAAINLLHATYDNWRKDKKEGFIKLYEAMRDSYNPLWNVDATIGLITEDTHTGTDTMRKTGTDTSKLSGSDKSTQGGSDVTTLSGQDKDILSGSDSLKQTGTIADAHTGTVSAAHDGKDTTEKEVKKDKTKFTGKEINHKAGIETTDNVVYTFDNQSTPMKTDSSTLSYPAPDSANARADIRSFDERVDEREYEDKITDTYDSDLTTTYNNTDTQTFNKTDATTYGKTDTIQYGKTDTTQYGKSDTTQYGRQDQMTHNTTDTETKDLQDKHIEMNIRQGNIGVTSSQSLLMQQLSLTDKDALIDYMIADFVHTCCII